MNEVIQVVYGEGVWRNGGSKGKKGKVRDWFVSSINGDESLKTYKNRTR